MRFLLVYKVMVMRVFFFFSLHPFSGVFVPFCTLQWIREVFSLISVNLPCSKGLIKNHEAHFFFLALIVTPGSLAHAVVFTSSTERYAQRGDD